MKLRNGFLALLALTLAHCTHKSSSPSDDGDMQAPAVTVKVDDQSQLTDGEKRVYQRLEKNQPVSFREITRLMIEKHVQAAKAHHPEVDVNTLQAFIDKIKPSAPMTPAKTKITYENGIIAAASAHNQKYLYNKDKNNIVDTFTEFKMQCYSGTYMYEVVRRQVGAVAFHAGNEVVIFQSGHVLPGYMVQDFNRDTKKQEWKLIGMETTVLRGARHDFGFVSYGLPEQVVVDADLFALSEIYGSKMSNAQEFVSKAIEYTAKKYGIKDAAPKNETASADVEEMKRQLNSSIFGFGIPDTAPGDLEIAVSSDDGTRSDLYPKDGMLVAREIENIASIMKHSDCSVLDGTYESAEPVNGKTLKFWFKSSGCRFINSTNGTLTFAHAAGGSVILMGLESGKPTILKNFQARVGAFVTQIPGVGEVRFFRRSQDVERVDEPSTLAAPVPDEDGNAPMIGDSVRT